MEKSAQISRNLRVALVVVLLCLIPTVGALFWRVREPSCNGRRASDWFEQAEGLRAGERPDALKPIAEMFRSMGPEGLEFLLHQLKRKDSQSKRQVIRWLVCAPMADTMKSRLLTLSASDVTKRHIAVDILSAMGPAAESAVPALVMACKDEDPVISGNAAIAIRQIARPRVALPILTNCLSDRRPWPVAAAASSLFLLAHVKDVDCSGTVPALRAALGTRDEHAWFEVARALSKIDPDHSATLLMPNISEILSEPPTQPHRLPQRVIQILTLGIVENLGPHAKECLPQVLSLTNNMDKLVREMATRAIAKIEVISRQSGTDGLQE